MSGPPTNFYGGASTASKVRKALAAVGHQMAAPNGAAAKQLRTMHPDAPGLALWRMLANPAVPDEWTSYKLWKVLLPAMAAVPHRADGDAKIGGLFQKVGISELRMDRLLAATGENLVQEAIQLVGIVAGKGHRGVDWSDLAILMVADASGDLEGLEHGRRMLALAYARAVPQPRRQPKASEGQPAETSEEIAGE